MKFRCAALALLTSACLSVGFFSDRGVQLLPVQGLLSDAMPVVVVDAGHGGFDGGAVSGGVLEKDLNLQIAKKLEIELLRAGYQVVMTRTEDTALKLDGKGGKTADLHARAKIVEQYPSAILVSVHINQFPVAKYSGSQVFYPRGAEDSKRLAQYIQQSIREDLQPDNKREIKAAGREIYLLSQADIPAVLVECGFISNPGERMLLQGEGYQESLAKCIVKGLTSYYNTVDDQIENDDAGGPNAAS
ncbi:MAG: hypothetical protein GXX99_05100 [Clostridiales bacterium]|nr:hypothetical protein [Clostridiales bacterium]